MKKCLLFLLFITAMDISAQTPATKKPTTTITKIELDFLGAAGSYLKTANEKGMRVAKAMAGAANGTSTLTEIKAAFTAAIRVENAGYAGDYKARIKGNIPTSSASIASNVDETHRLFQAALREYLEYWKDQNTAHINSGAATLKRCTLLMNKTIDTTTAKMKELSK